MTDFFVTVAPGLEELLGEELKGLGIDASHTHAGVAFSGSLADAYRVCLWSRLASRVLLPIARFEAGTDEQLYLGSGAVDWSEHFDTGSSFAVSANLRKSRLTHSRFAALRVKDAIVDQFRARCGDRPSVSVQRPDLQLQLFVDRDRAILSLDLSGESLHRRGYRLEGVRAPLKETLAAAMLLRSGWPETFASGGSLVDPMCGSGTLVIEGALLAARVAPGLLRDYFGFFGWKQHQADTWKQLCEEASASRRQAPVQSVAFGFDQDGRAVAAARDNLRRAGLEDWAEFSQRAIKDLRNPLPGHEGTGLLLVNPPYGERLGEIDQLGPLYAELGRCWREEFDGWRASLLTGQPELAFQVGLRSDRYHHLNNGQIPCRLLHFDICAANYRTAGERRKARPAALEKAQMLVNRLRKNQKALTPWLRREEISCYRLYDRDLPEYALAIDRYGELVHVQEYHAPSSIDERQAAERLAAALEVLPEALQVAPENIYCKVRQRQRGTSQYQKQGEQGTFHEVGEGGLRFRVNLADYLDTGLFLDHRLTRALLREAAAGKRFLNLFAYTGTATVYAAAGGAVSTTSVDMSRTYLDWAARNLELNGLSGRQHRLVQADCLDWLRREQGRYELIFLDPPSFSNSKRMQGAFDVQRDHVELIRLASGLLTEDGMLIFSTNLRSFRLDEQAVADLHCEELTAATIPMDFRRNAKIHRCWRLRQRPGGRS